MRSVLALFPSTRHLDFADSVVEGDSNYDGKMVGVVPAGAAAAAAARCNDRGALDTSPFSILHLCSLDHVRRCEFCVSVILINE